MAKVEERPILINYEEARTWYKSSNMTLRTLALKAFTAQELEMSYKQIINNSDKNIYCVEIIAGNFKNIYRNIVLTNLATALNKGWKKDATNTGYSIDIDQSGNYIIKTHILEKYLGIIYFKDIDTANTALNILKTELTTLPLPSSSSNK